ncbi:LOB domain-containing protein 7-like [Solanum dulcamara]|uniref:LOB domain-containing protein 7-like n=1 Tax=Solanum dulcamara TaxID=45834 RepID=UPI00248686E6|nr:LOB domain-containing protein 7-like [Solanum dulcamara]
MTNIVNNNQNISSGLTPSSLNTTTTTTRVASRGGNGSQACAACKYQRRRCTPDCPLAPYFPVERQKDFLNAHKLFGVSNILKVLKNVAPFHRDNAMKALIFEANIRAGDPVGGCYRVILNLHRLINLYQTELQFVYSEIFRVQAEDIQQHPNNINTKARSVQGINNSMLSFEPSPLQDGFNRLCIGESSNQIVNDESSNQISNQIVKGEVFDDQFETKVAISSSKGKQSFVEHGDLKPYFGNFYDCKGKGVATELSDDKVVSKTRVN